MTWVWIAEVRHWLGFCAAPLLRCLYILDMDMELGSQQVTGYYIYDRFHLGMYFSAASEQTVHVLLKLHTSE